MKGAARHSAYTHPAVVANLLRAALLAANDPLSPSQEQAIVTLGTAWAADAERSLAAVGEGAPALARIVAEGDAKQRFLEAVKATLTPSQRAVLFHRETEGRLGLDLLSPVLVYMAHEGVEAATADDLARTLVGRLLARSGAKDVDAAPLAWIGGRWLEDVPSSTTPRAAGDPEGTFPTLVTMQACARAQVAAVGRLAESGRLPPEGVERLRRATLVLTPQVVR